MSEYLPKVKMTVGKFAGVPVAQLPVSYCRWILGQDFDKEIMEVAKLKVDASPISNEPLNVSRHAIDRFSLRFIDHWNGHLASSQEKHDGISTFLVKMAEEAWEDGEDISKNRHKEDGIVKKHKGIKYVFIQSKEFPDYKELVTVM